MSLKSKLSLSTGRPVKSSEGLWAISYADFLMVLLSFFIIFFSMDEKSSLHKVFIDLSKAGIVQPIAKPNPEASAQASKVAATKNVEESIISSNMKVIMDLNSKIESSSLVKHMEKEKLILQLPEDIYATGDYLPKVALLDPIIVQLRPYSRGLKIKVIGHSDTAVFKGMQNRVIRDNLTLSSIRASYSANYLKAFYPEMLISAEADDQNRRKTRSISIEIEAFEGTKK
jgi:flagellar motor protein MotB